MIDYTVTPDQLADIADQGYRCGVDSRVLCQVLYGKEPNQLTYTEAVRLISQLLDTPSFP